MRESDSVTPIALEGLAFQFFARLHRRRLRSVRIDGEPAWLQRVREYLHDNFNQAIRLRDLAAEAGVHPDHASRAFIQAYGESFGSYLRRIRIESARAYLRSTALPISEIAYRCGISDQSHLTRVFKRVSGTTPAEYRASGTTKRG